MLLCVTGSGKFQKSNIEEDYLNEWFSQYIGKFIENEKILIK
jgi:hypothetical protein